MTKIFPSQTNNGQDKFSTKVLDNNLNLEASSTSSSSEQIELTQAKVPLAVPKSSTEESNFEPKNAKRESIFRRLQAQTIAVLVGSVVMLPILAVGTGTYYFGNLAVNKQIVLAKRGNNLDLLETELARQQKLLAALLIGTGTSAWLVGTIAAFMTKRLLDEMSQSASDTVAKTSETSNIYIESALQPNILEAIVEEVRTYLNCDRVAVYSLNQDNYGVIVAESVATGYTKGLGKTIEDPCFEIKYRNKYRNGISAMQNTSLAIADIDKASMTNRHKEQLEQLQVKANLVTSIVNENRLFGLLVAHQCSAPREWRQGEIEFLRQLAKRAALAIENAKLLEDLASLGRKTETERKWTHYFTDAVRYIRQSIEQEDILEISVEEVQRALTCDRVVVYSLNQDNYGVVIAESVSAGYPKALNKVIEDPCFEARYLDKYRDGRVRAIDNIYEAGMSRCYIEQLETLQVKANLVTPILNEGKLFGLLVAHQCSDPRHWQDYEIRWMTQIATQVGFALDNATLLAKSNTKQLQAETERKWSHYFIDAVRYIRQSIKQEDVLKISVEEVQRALSCDRVVVYSLNQDNYGVVIAESVSAGYPKALNKVIEDPCFEARYLDKYRDGRVRAIDNIYEAGMSRCYIEQLETLQVKANLVTPILNEGKLFGLLVAHQCSDPRHWQDYEIRWMTQIATQVGFALDNATLLEKLKNDDLPTQLLNNFSSSLSEKIPRAELLEIAVEQIQEIIKLDRVIIYQFDDDGGNVVAESVVCGYPQGANFQLKNFDFATEYSKSYWSKAKAIANIDRANLTDSHREKLKILEVKASLTVPIWQDGQIFALLIGHQCQQPRIWLQSEIDLFTQLALQLGLVLDRLKLQELDLNKNTPIDGVRQNGIEPYTQDEHNTEQKAIAAMDIEVLDLPQQNHYPTVNLIDNIPENNYYPSTIIKPLKLSTTDITVEAKEIASEPVLIAGQLVKTNLDNNVILVDQFVGEITNLSERITQQSLFVTESFQKLAAFAKELSEKNNSRN